MSLNDRDVAQAQLLILHQRSGQQHIDIWNASIRSEASPGNSPDVVSASAAMTCITITGPMSPADMADLLSLSDGVIARDIHGYRGVSPTELVRVLIAMGVDVEVVTCAPEVEQRLELQGPSLRVLVGPKRSRARELALDLFRQERDALLGLLKETEAEVIHAHWTYEFAWAALDADRPTLVTARDAPFTIWRHTRDTYRAMRAVMAYIVRARIRHLTTVSPYLASCWQREMLYRRPITVIPNIATLPGTSSIAKNHPLPRSLGHLGSVANIVDVSDGGKRKNIRALIEAHALIRSQGREVTLELVGPGLGPDDELSSYAQTLGYADSVRFRGVLRRDQVSEILAKATLFVHTSLEESFGVSVVEAMVAGVPVVAGVRSGAVPWVLAGGDAGLLVDVRKPAALAAGITRLLGDQDYADRLAARGREHALSAFDSRTVASAYLDAYASVRRAFARSGRQGGRSVEHA